MESTQLKKIIEGALLAAGKPVSVDQLLSLFGLEGAQPSRDEVRSALEDIGQDSQDRGFELKQVSSGYRFQVRQEFAPWVSRLWEEKPQKYSRALLETIAIIAYRQPMTRGEIEEIRGVSVSSNITKTLLEREWVRIVGHRDVPGKPALFATTKQFLDYFNLKRLDELPTLSEIQDLADFAPELALADPEAEPANDEHNGEIDLDQQIDESLGEATDDSAKGLDGSLGEPAEEHENELDAESAGEAEPEYPESERRSL